MSHKISCDHNWGFFSCCSMRLRAINRYCVEHGVYPWVDSTQQWRSYKDSPEQDISTILFDEPRRVGTRSLRDVIGCDQDGDATWLQYDDYGLIDYHAACDLVFEYFNPSAAVFAVQDDIESRNGINPDRSLSACFRGSDKRSETAIPSYQEFVDAIEQHRRTESGRLDVVLQTDEEELVQFVSDLDYKILNELPTTSSYGRAIHYDVPEGGRVKFAVKFLAICQTLSRCRRMVLNSGNVGLWLCLYRGAASGVCQYRSGKWIYHPEAAK